MDVVLVGARLRRRAEAARGRLRRRGRRQRAEVGRAGVADGGPREEALVDAVLAGLHIPTGLEDLGAAVLDDGRRAREVRGALLTQLIEVVAQTEALLEDGRVRVVVVRLRAVAVDVLAAGAAEVVARRPVVGVVARLVRRLRRRRPEEVLEHGADEAAGVIDLVLRALDDDEARGRDRSLRDREELLDVVGRQRRLARRLREGDARLGRRAESEGEDEAHHRFLWACDVSMKFTALLALWLLSAVAPCFECARGSAPTYRLSTPTESVAGSAGA